MNNNNLQETIQKCRNEIEQLSEQLNKDRVARMGAVDLIMCKEGVATPQCGNHKLRERKLLRGHFGKVYALQWCPGEGNDDKLVSASQDGKLIVWNGLTSNKTKIGSVVLSLGDDSCLFSFRLLCCMWRIR